MKRIKVMFYVDPDDLPEGIADTEHEMGITDDAYTSMDETVVVLAREAQDMSFTLVDDD